MNTTFAKVVAIGAFAVLCGGAYADNDATETAKDQAKAAEKSAKQAAKAEYDAAKKRCGTLDGNERDVCDGPRRGE